MQDAGAPVRSMLFADGDEGEEVSKFLLDHASHIFPPGPFSFFLFFFFLFFGIDCAQFITGGIFNDNIACQPLIEQVGDLKDDCY